MSGSFDRDRLPDWPAYADTHGIKVEGRGKWRSVLCDFHDDTHASLRINIETGGWRCMSCGESGGDTLAHHMQRTGLDFIEAAKQLGAWIPDGQSTGRERVRRLAARDALELLHADIFTAYIVIRDAVRGHPPNEVDRSMLLAIANRVLLVYEDVNK